jgi:hypothetical protein
VLLREVARRAGPGDVVVLVDVQDYLTEFGADGGGAGAGGELRRFGRMLSAMAEGLRDRPAARGAVDAVLNEVGRAVRAAGDAGLDGAGAQALADDLVGRVLAEANELIRARAAAGGRVLVLVDTFELAAAGPGDGAGEREWRPFGRWLLGLLGGLRGAVVAVARRPGPGAVPLAGALGSAAEVLEVGGLTQEQVHDYLGRRLVGQGAEIAGAVSGFTGGNALAVGLTADLAEDLSRPRRDGAEPAAGLDGLIRRLNTGRDDPDKLVGRLVSLLIENVDPEVRLGLDCLWAVRRFDFPLLERLLAVGGSSAGRHRLAERLVGYSFVERRTPPGRPAEEYYVVHDRIRDEGQRDNSRIDELVAEAQGYYQEQTDEFLDGYEGWFRYEDPKWQALVREWLYHVRRLKGVDREEARRGITKLFMDAFWWWGNYISFPFCEELLADWAEMADSLGKDAGNVDRAWGEQLRELYVRYPKGWRRRAEREDWTEVRRLLIDFLRKPELREQRLKDPDKKQKVRHVRGLLEIYMADAERFLDPGSRRVDEHLLAARELFAADDDEWDVAWVWFQQGDAALSRGDAEGAITAAAAGWRTLMEMDDDDPELAANLHRVHADAAWDGGNHGLALDLYARAALHAYGFQVAVADPDRPPVDEYTQAFLIEMRERAADRLTAMHAAGEMTAALEACARIRRFFAPYAKAVDAPGPGDPDAPNAPNELNSLLAAGRAEEAVGRLFPPPPAPADLHQPGTSYALTASEVLYDMGDELAFPPGTPLPRMDGD